MAILEESGADIILCDLENTLSPFDDIGFVFWDSQERLTFNDVTMLQFIVPNAFSSYVNLELVSQYTPFTFYENFIEENSACLVIDSVAYTNLIFPE